MSLRVAMGYDIHRLVPGRPLFLGCVEIPSERGLLGHSDGDAAAHALADALLSAAGLGDIGTHFPGNPEWEGVSGATILERTRDLLAERGARLVQADLTVLAEAPRIAPHRDAMLRGMSAALQCSLEILSIKGRTNEGLGEIGRGEAIAVWAVALVEVG